ncbi:MAG: 3-oxoacyl-ACP reductase [Acidiferrobacteraceae bacterium]|jgi:3-oxoacyl-[acyl-carrier protein] reductase|uniref:Ketoreductase domain-containing protein n=1 Tax=marine metagenome TaxID=408172 RepID=A0A381SZY7_9ZZZZ|nr:3-oxoacyl-ACP reductase [Acidiferrobacteraceae bacterium]MCS5555177.1 SDR family oxidoreductase [Arenicellales bacterium]MDP7452497.1 SDR family NAD(P)-dependent oxidoreductase [Arenicellales bacterium]MEC8872381.1 SDR family NAD(P)-dependent oxidoreductase [Pseudomonadota bacterium]|tara:strand:+ start:2022 stop:2783 length:762 start_codon:yes stop_codon:yes gene_type:complete
MMELLGKTVVVTGGGRGLGRAYCESLAEQGANVVAADIRDTGNTIEAVKSAGGHAIGVHLDVTDPISCNDMANAAIEAYGRIDSLVNNAALYGDISGGRFDQISDSQWDNVMNVNIKGIWNCCRACVPSIRESGGGTIINISSLAATYGMPYALDYAMSKAAVIGMTRSLARELGRDWIRVNAVAPTAVLTEGTEEYMGEKMEKALAVIASNQALSANLEPKDMVGTISFLVSDASKFITGQTIMVDGGTTLL